MLPIWRLVLSAAIVTAATLPISHGFQFSSSSRIAGIIFRSHDAAFPTTLQQSQRAQQGYWCRLTTTTTTTSSSLFMSDSKKETPGKISGEQILSSSSVEQKNEKGDNDEEEEEEVGQAATGTVNERLLLELQDAADKEKYGARSSFGKKLGLDSFRSRKTDEERQAAIEEARNLNGVNPLVTGVGSIFAIGVAILLWQATTTLGVFFATHPVATDTIFVQRTAAVFRNVVVGLVSLSSGFFGVTGLGIFLLTVRVAYGIFTGELDPTPIVKKAPTKAADDDLELPNVMDLMLGKRQNRRSSKDKDNDFGGL